MQIGKRSDYRKLKELAKTEKTSFFGEGFGVGAVSVGLMFSIDGSDDHDAIYVYHETTSIKRPPL